MRSYFLSGKYVATSGSTRRVEMLLLKVAIVLGVLILSDLWLSGKFRR